MLKIESTVCKKGIQGASGSNDKNLETMLILKHRTHIYYEFANVQVSRVMCFLLIAIKSHIYGNYFRTMNEVIKLQIIKRTISRDGSYHHEILAKMTLFNPTMSTWINLITASITVVTTILEQWDLCD